MPTAPIDTFTNIRLVPAFNPASALMKHCSLVAGTYLAGTVIGELTATPGTFKAYVDAAADGSGVAKGLLRYGCVVDGSGNIRIGDEPATQVKSIEYYIAGYFQCADLVGLDAAAVADLSGHLTNGTITTGVLHF